MKIFIRVHKDLIIELTTILESDTDSQMNDELFSLITTCDVIAVSRVTLTICDILGVGKFWVARQHFSNIYNVTFSSCHHPLFVDWFQMICI